MNDDRLETKSDLELDEIFAQEIAQDKWRKIDVHGQRSAANYSSSADTVLPWLAKHPGWIACCREDGQYQVTIEFAGKTLPRTKTDPYTTIYLSKAFAEAASFPRAAVIALIRAKRIEKGR